jgi:hypothetical protein
MAGRNEKPPVSMIPDYPFRGHGRPQKEGRMKPHIIILGALCGAAAFVGPHWAVSALLLIALFAYGVAESQAAERQREIARLRRCQRADALMLRAFSDHYAGDLTDAQVEAVFDEWLQRHDDPRTLSS